VERDQIAKRLAVAPARRLDQRLDVRGLPALGNLRVLGVGERHEVGDGDRHWVSRHRNALFGWIRPKAPGPRLILLTSPKAWGLWPEACGLRPA
jgi:hypothetical protein